MNNSKSYDVIIVGAGSVGVPAAYYLAKSGYKVLVLDMLASHGQGSNKHAIGGVKQPIQTLQKFTLAENQSKFFPIGKLNTVMTLSGVRADIVLLPTMNRQRTV